MTQTQFEVSYAPSSEERHDLGTLRLQSAGGPIESDYLGHLQPTTLDTPFEEMRERFAKDGYLWVKGAIPRELVLQARKDYFDYLQPFGVLKEGTDTVDGIFCGGDWRLWMGMGKLRQKLGYGEENRGYLDALINAHSADWYRRFVSHPSISSFIEKFTGWNKALLLDRTILRPSIPGGESTHVHYDQIFLRGGPPTSITSWIPMGDVQWNGGGLIYLQGSAQIGKEIERKFNAAAAHLSEAERISAYNETMMDTGYLEPDSGKFSRIWGKKWLVADYEAGDLVLHSPYMIHSSARNDNKEGVIRLATDLRFVEEGKPYDTRWMNIYQPGDEVER